MVPSGGATRGLKAPPTGMGIGYGAAGSPAMSQDELWPGAGRWLRTAALIDAFAHTPPRNQTPAAVSPAGSETAQALIAVAPSVGKDSVYAYTPNQVPYREIGTTPPKQTSQAPSW